MFFTPGTEFGSVPAKLFLYIAIFRHIYSNGCSHCHSHPNPNRYPDPSSLAHLNPIPNPSASHSP